VGVDGSLRAAVERVVEAQFGAAARVVSLSSEPSRFATASPAEVLTVGLRNGSTFRVFVKRLAADRSGNPDKRRRDREPMVYERLLAAPGLATPVFYGSRFDVKLRRRDVLLEYVDDWSLKYHGLDHWATATARLAALHAHFAREHEQLARSDFLLRLDRRYFSAWAGRAVAAVTSLSERLARALDRPLSRHDETMEVMCEQPVTLVHNDLAPKNVIADSSSTPARICIVDWELAGAGCGVLDLVHLVHGLEERQEQALCAAYCAELSCQGLLPTGRELRRLLSACKLQNTLYRLAHLRQWGIGPTTAEEWVDDVARLQADVAPPPGRRARH
jgi:Phosphotransferase enzyme family